MHTASPPKFINVEDVMRLANGVTNMALAHEIAVSGEFRLEQGETKPDRLFELFFVVMFDPFNTGPFTNILVTSLL